MAGVGCKGSALARRSAMARSTSSGSVATGETSIAPAAGSIIQRGILRSMPSGPRTVMGRWERREAETTSSSWPASGWKR
jgi:hypothetical protein